MPKKYVFPRDLVQMRVSARLRDYLTMQKRYKEPLDRVADRIFGDAGVKETIETYVDPQEIIENKDRIIKKLQEENKILRNRLQELRKIDVQLTQFMRNDD